MNEAKTNIQIEKLNTYIDNLNDVKENISNELPELRYDGINAKTALKSFENNMQKLQTINTEVQHIYTSELNAIHEHSVNILKAINILEKANLLYHDFIVDKLSSGNSDMEFYEQVFDDLIEVFHSLKSVKVSLKQLHNESI